MRFVTCATLPAPDPDTPRLVDALGARDVDVAVDDWRDPAVDWRDTPFTMLRSPWDYVERLDEFLAWAEHVATVSALWNPIALIRWNTHKAYLLELAAAGAPVVPTVLLLQGSAAALDGIADAQGWNSVVVKPAVAVGGHGAGRFDVGDPAGQAHLDALLAAGESWCSVRAVTEAVSTRWCSSTRGDACGPEAAEAGDFASTSATAACSSR